MWRVMIVTMALLAAGCEDLVELHAGARQMDRRYHSLDDVGRRADSCPVQNRIEGRKAPLGSL